MNFPKLSIPGTKSLAPIPKRILNSNASASPTATKQLNKSKSQQLMSLGAPNNRPVRVPSSSVSLSGEHRAPSLGMAAADSAFAGTYQTTDLKTQEKLTLFREIVRRIDGYMKRKHLRVIDLFRFCDADGNGSISPQEMIDTLSQMEIQLTAEQGQDFINYIDKDGNGSIDIDEFEELVRVARRNEAQRDQLKKELSHAKKAPVETKPSAKFSTFIKFRQRICDEFKSVDVADYGALSASQLRSILSRLNIPGVDEILIDGLIERTLAAGSAASSLSAADSSSLPSTSTSPASAEATPNLTGMVYYNQLCRVLEDLEWSRKSNRFLDHSWISQFDSQMDRAVREFDLL
uniref:EF-hand domain-containing protein n=1 Tax=Globisporangium ultimum (strain ATCC 200006 / CBS 805.95 / DAOM BR144) TaxID=431595 RepID=K3X0Z5_GLOUD